MLPAKKQPNQKKQPPARGAAKSQPKQQQLEGLIEKARDFILSFFPGGNISLKIVHKGAILVLVPLIFELFFLAVLTELLHQAELEVQRQVRSKAIISQANTLSKLFYDAGVAMGGYSITKRDRKSVV